MSHPLVPWQWQRSRHALAAQVVNSRSPQMTHVPVSKIIFKCSRNKRRITVRRRNVLHKNFWVLWKIRQWLSLPSGSKFGGHWKVGPNFGVFLSQDCYCCTKVTRWRCVLCFFSLECVLYRLITEKLFVLEPLPLRWCCVCFLNELFNFIFLFMQTETSVDFLVVSDKKTWV